MNDDQDLVYRARNYPKQKSLGQNFLVSSAILNKIVSSVKLDPQKDTVLEIGPGIGFLTERLIPLCRHLYSVELDANAIKYLKLLKINHNNFDYLRDDILALSVEDVLTLNSYSQKFKEHSGQERDNDELIDDTRRELGRKNLSEIQSGALPKIKIVANIPYQITTRILLHFLGEIGEANANRELISEINILVQKEFAQRLMAKPGVKAYGAVTLLVQYYAEVEALVEVARGNFMPSPEVDSTFIKIKLRDKPLIETAHPKQLRRFIKAIFANRRKKLTNGLQAAGYQKEDIAKLNLSENLRGETLTLQEINEFVNILN